MADDPGYRYSVNQTVSDGAQTLFEISFSDGYISRDHVKVVVVRPDGTSYTPEFSWVGDYQIMLSAPAPIGYTVRRYRETPVDRPVVDFADRSIVNELSLDLNARQAVFAVAEIKDGFENFNEAIEEAAIHAAETAAQAALGQLEAATDLAENAADAALAAAGNARPLEWSIGPSTAGQTLFTWVPGETGPALTMPPLVYRSGVLLLNRNGYTSFTWTENSITLTEPTLEGEEVWLLVGDASLQPYTTVDRVVGLVDILDGAASKTTVIHLTDPEVGGSEDADDNTPAFIAAFNILSAAGGGVLMIPPGKFRRTKVMSLPVPSNIAIKGYGPSSIVKFIDDPGLPRRDCFYANGIESIDMSDFVIEGVLDQFQTQTNQSQMISLNNVSKVRITNMTLRMARYMSIALGRCSDVLVSGCRIEDSLRDGIHLANCRDGRVVNNICVRVADDMIAIHSQDAASLVPEFNVVIGNQGTLCQGMKFLGAKNLVVSHNTMQLSLRNPILVGVHPLSTGEGWSPVYSIDISHNVIMDTFATLDEVFAIKVAIGDRKPGSLSTKPGSNSSVLPYTYVNDYDAAGKVNIGGMGVRVCNNTVGRARASGVLLSSYGAGLRLERGQSGKPLGWIDFTTTEADFGITGIWINGPVRGLDVSHNQLYGAGYNPAGCPAMRIDANGPDANGIVLEDALVSYNQVFDWMGTGLYLMHSGANNAKCINIIGNSFNLDPLFRMPGHYADNTWASVNSLVGVVNNNVVYAGTMTGNHFKNLSRAHGAGTPLIMNDNYVYYQPGAGTVGFGDIASNKGVRFIDLVGFIPVVIDGVPTSPTFGQVITQPQEFSNSMPTSGTYVYGTLIKTRTAVPSSVDPTKFVFGWTRVTTGSGHVLNTDWVELLIETSL